MPTSTGVPSFASTRAGVVDDGQTEMQAQVCPVKLMPVALELVNVTDCDPGVKISPEACGVTV